MNNKARKLHPAWIEVNVTQLLKNINSVRNYVNSVQSGTKICLPIKANAYGHGLVRVAKTAVKAKIDYLAVAHLSEGIALRKANIKIPILVLGAIHKDQSEELISNNLEISISSMFKAQLIVSTCLEKNLSCRVHLEVDTGMQRTGVKPQTLHSIFLYLLQYKFINIVGIYSHLASADTPNDPFTLKQIQIFNSIKEDPLFHGHSLLWHLSNSSGLINYPLAHFDMVRPSLLIFGYKQESINNVEFFDELRPCFSIKAKVSYIKIVDEHQGISYGHTYITKKKSKIATVPVGYGDGYRRALSNKANVLINGKKHPICGTICMDQFMVDVGEDNVQVGDLVTLIGKDGENYISLTEIAGMCQTIPYEILCGFNDRMPRIYIN